MKIIENVIPRNIQDDLERKVLDHRFPWHYLSSAVLGVQVNKDYLEKKREEFLNGEIVDTKLFFHNILVDSNPGPFFSWFTPLIDVIQYEGLSILRMNMNFSIPLFDISGSSWGVPHVDLPDETSYTTGVYYVTDADGDTILFNEKYGYQGKLTIQKRIKPTKGTLILFDGNTLHAASPPRSNKPRIVVNINIR